MHFSNSELVIIFAALVGLYTVYRLARFVRMLAYFSSPAFAELKESVESLVRENRDILEYIRELEHRADFEIGLNDSGSHAHFADFVNVSTHNYRRDRNLSEASSPRVKSGSLDLVRRASREPIKYLVKYFMGGASEASLQRLEEVGGRIERLESAINNFNRRGRSILSSVSPPPFIKRHYLPDLGKQLGVVKPIEVPQYPEYSFEYVSPGGNSAQKAEIAVRRELVDAAIEHVGRVLDSRKSAAHQRSLMTSSLRKQIKSRDSYECQICSLSALKVPSLLLEVDHIKPVSRGGLSVPENLQTLCWRCNRQKGASV